jgi:hypothetical protein
MQFSSAMLYDESIDVVGAEEVESPTSISIKDRDLYNFQDKKTDYDEKVCMLAWLHALYLLEMVTFSSLMLNIFSSTVNKQVVRGLNGCHPCFRLYIVTVLLGQSSENLYLTLYVVPNEDT